MWPDPLIKSDKYLLEGTYYTAICEKESGHMRLAQVVHFWAAYQVDLMLSLNMVTMIHGITKV